MSNPRVSDDKRNEALKALQNYVKESHALNSLLNVFVDAKTPDEIYSIFCRVFNESHEQLQNKINQSPIKLSVSAQANLQRLILNIACNTEDPIAHEAAGNMCDFFRSHQETLRCYFNAHQYSKNQDDQKRLLAKVEKIIPHSDQRRYYYSTLAEMYFSHYLNELDSKINLTKFLAVLGNLKWDDDPELYLKLIEIANKEGDKLAELDDKTRNRFSKYASQLAEEGHYAAALIFANNSRDQEKVVPLLDKYFDSIRKLEKLDVIEEIKSMAAMVLRKKGNWWQAYRVLFKFDSMQPADKKEAEQKCEALFYLVKFHLQQNPPATATAIKFLQTINACAILFDLDQSRYKELEKAYAQGHNPDSQRLSPESKITEGTSSNARVDILLSASMPAGGKIELVNLNPTGDSTASHSEHSGKMIHPKSRAGIKPLTANSDSKKDVTSQVTPKVPKAQIASLKPLSKFNPNKRG